MNMVFTSRGKRIVFDDYEDNTAEFGSYWVEMCSHCRNKYRSILGERIDEGSACGICSVKGCENEASDCVDFSENEVYLTNY